MVVLDPVPEMVACIPLLIEPTSLADTEVETV